MFVCLKSDLLFVLLLLRDTAEATPGFFSYFQGQILTILEHPSIFKSECLQEIFDDTLKRDVYLQK